MRVLFVVPVCLMISDFYAQHKKEPALNPPVNSEIMAGSRGVSFQMIIDKPLKSAPQLDFLSVTDLNTDWNDKEVQDIMTQAGLSVNLAKGFRLYGGFHYTPITGIRPSGGIIYSFVNEKWTLIAFARTDLKKAPNAECMLLVEFKPRINDNWRFYSRVQALYSQMTAADQHGRSYIRGRAGLSFSEVSFGAASNSEYYGPSKVNENSIGLFMQALLF